MLEVKPISPEVWNAITKAIEHFWRHKQTKEEKEKEKKITFQKTESA